MDNRYCVENSHLTMLCPSVTSLPGAPDLYISVTSPPHSLHQVSFHPISTIRGEDNSTEVDRAPKYVEGTPPQKQRGMSTTVVVRGVRLNH